MQLGAFSVSLAVRDLQSSRDFYEKLGFSVFGGDQDQHWLIMKNGETLIGLFEGMFEQNILTFNPGWDSSAGELDSFTDVRELQARLKEQGIEPVTPIASDTTGSAHFVLEDPDGNTILIDQHR